MEGGQTPLMALKVLPKWYVAKSFKKMKKIQNDKAQRLPHIHRLILREREREREKKKEIGKGQDSKSKVIDR